jgi:DNA-directed RNA polymerase subunit RPC12/RpoP
MDLKTIDNPLKIAHREVEFFKRIKYKDYICNTCDSTFDENPGAFCKYCSQGMIISKRKHQESMIKIIIGLLTASAKKEEMDLDETRRLIENFFKREGLNEWKYLLLQ